MTPTAFATYRDAGFHSADDNIGCWITRDYYTGVASAAHCYAQKHRWKAKPADCGDISPFEEFLVKVASSRGTRRTLCIGGVPWNLDYTKYASPWEAPTLRPGKTKRIGAIRCVARSRSRIRCTNGRLHGFDMSRQKFVLF